jgi:hypothetical protein
MTIDRNLPINFQKGEQIVWAFPNSKYYEDKESLNNLPPLAQPANWAERSGETG